MTTWAGARAMATHEFRLRLRAGRWKWLLLAWFLVLAAFTLLMGVAVDTASQGNQGATMFGALMLVVLALGMLVVPALTAQSVNGDRERGVLAPLQTTLLTSWEIALGKLLAAWVVTWVFLLISVPLVLWCVAAGGVGLARAAVTLVIVGLLLGVIAAVALCMSSLLARSTTSVVMSYLAVFALNVGPVIVFGLVLGATATTETVRERQPVIGTDGFVVEGEFEEYTYESTVTHEEDWWWLIAPNPFVVLADAVPSGGDEVDDVDPLAALRDAVRSSRAQSNMDGLAPEDSSPVWPYGLTVNLMMGAAALTLSARRLRTPYRALPKAVRVA